MSLLLLFKGVGGGGTPASTSFPEVVVQIGFAAVPSTALASVAWTDVSAYVRGGSTNRGRSTELDQFQAGTCQVTLDNRDLRFDPTYTAGPYYGNLLPMRRIRILAGLTGVTFALFTGYVTEWPQDYDASGEDATVTVSGVDGTEVLQQATVNSSALAQAIQFEDAAGGVWAWYRMGETAGSVSADSGSFHHDATYVNFPDRLPSTSSLVAYSNDPAMTFSGGYQLAPKYDVSSFAAGPLYLETVIQTTSTGTELIVDGYGLYVYIVGGQLGAGAPNAAVYQAGPLINDGQPHHLLLDLSAAPKPAFFYIDGVDYSASLAAGAVTAPNVEALQAVSIGGTNDGTSTASSCVFDEVVWYNDNVTAPAGFLARVAAHAALITAPYDGDSSGTRMGRVLDAASWPTADRNLDTGSSTLGPQALSGSAQGLAQTVEASEQGQFFFDASGNATLQARTSRVTGTHSANVQATFGEDLSTQFPYYSGQGFRLLYDRTTIRNTVTGQRDGGASLTLSDSTSVTSYGTRGWQTPALVNRNDNDVRALLQYQLDRYSQPLLRIPAITVRPRTPPPAGASWTQAQLWAAALGAEISYRYNLKRNPQDIGTGIDQDVILEGVAHTFTPMFWETKLYGSPADTRTYFVLGTGALGTDRLFM